MLETSDRALLRRADVERLIGLGKSALYARIAQGEFPRPLRVGAVAVRWRYGDVRRWLESRPVAGDTGGRGRGDPS